MAIQFVIFLALASTISTTKADVPLANIIIAPVASSYSAHTVHHAVATPVVAAPLVQGSLVPAAAPIVPAAFAPAPIATTHFAPAPVAFATTPIANAPQPVASLLPQKAAVFTPNTLVPISTLQPGQLFTIPSSNNQALKSQRGNKSLRTNRPAKLTNGRPRNRKNRARIVAAPNGQFLNPQAQIVPVRTSFVPASPNLVPVSASLVPVPARFMSPPAPVKTPFVGFSAPLIAKRHLLPVPSAFMVPPPLNQKLILG